MYEVVRVAELFAGVGGIRLGLSGLRDVVPPAGPFEVVWANQWEPPGGRAGQFAWRCYEERFGAGSCANADIRAVMDAAESGELDIPDVDMVVGGFPCQDYSVARPRSSSRGITGGKTRAP